jgi:hypothetical protein
VEQVVGRLARTAEMTAPELLIRAARRLARGEDRGPFGSEATRALPKPRQRSAVRAAPAPAPDGAVPAARRETVPRKTSRRPVRRRRYDGWRHWSPTTAGSARRSTARSTRSCWPTQLGHRSRRRSGCPGKRLANGISAGRRPRRRAGLTCASRRCRERRPPRVRSHSCKECEQGLPDAGLPGCSPAMGIGANPAKPRLSEPRPRVGAPKGIGGPGLLGAEPAPSRRRSTLTAADIT